jgi:hypothetical protein
MLPTILTISYLPGIFLLEVISLHTQHEPCTQLGGKAGLKEDISGVADLVPSKLPMAPKTRKIAERKAGCRRALVP